MGKALWRTLRHTAVAYVFGFVALGLGTIIRLAVEWVASGNPGSDCSTIDRSGELCLAQSLRGEFTFLYAWQIATAISMVALLLVRRWKRPMADLEVLLQFHKLEEPIPTEIVHEFVTGGVAETTALDGVTTQAPADEIRQRRLIGEQPVVVQLNGGRQALPFAWSPRVDFI